MGVSLDLCDKLLRAYFTPDVFTPDVNVFAAVTMVPGLVNSPGDSLTEPVAAAYSRSAVPLTSDYWALSGTGDLYNTVDLDFPPPTAGEDWGLLAAWALLDAPTGGVVLAVGGLVAPLYYVSAMPPLSLGPSGVTVSVYSA